MAFIRHKDGETFFLTKGKKSNNIPLIALHGGPGGTCNRLKDLFELASDRKIFIYDQIGGGKSSSIPASKWNIETFVKELKYLINHWKLKEFHLFGASWGTTLALEYLRREQDPRIKSIIFQSPMFSAADWERDANMLIKKLPKETQKVISYCHEINATDSQVYKDAIFEYYKRHVLRNETLLKKKSKPHDGHKVYQAMWGPSEFKATGSLKTYDQVDFLKHIKVPTLFVCGEHDEATPKTTKSYAKLVKKSEFHIIKGASHSILFEKKKPMLKVIDDFISKHS